MVKVAFPTGLMRLPLVGSWYRSSYSRDLLEASPDNTLVFMEREPGNNHDTNAIKINISNGKTFNKIYFAGYMQRHFAARMVKFLADQKDWNESDYVVGILKRLGKDFEVIPFGICGHNDCSSIMQKFYTDSTVSSQIINDCQVKSKFFDN